IIAPGIAAVGLTAVFLMILVNFDLMIEAEKNSALIYIMPGIIIGAGIVGSSGDKSSKPAVHPALRKCGNRINLLKLRKLPSHRAILMSTAMCLPKIPNHKFCQ